MPALTAEADFAAIIMEQDAYPPMCGHCIIGTATTVVATGMVEVVEPTTEVSFDTPAGLVRCEVAVREGRPRAVTFTNVESFLLLRDAELDGSLGRLAVDVAYGGDFCALVDADSLGIELNVANEAALTAAANEIRGAVESQLRVVHPERPEIDRCYMVQFTSHKTTTGGDGATRWWRRPARSTARPAAPAPRRGWRRCTPGENSRSTRRSARRDRSAPSSPARRWPRWSAAGTCS